MPFNDDLAGFYDVENGDAELVVVGGASVAAIFSTSTEVALGEALVMAPTLRLPAAGVVVADGTTCTVRSASYRVRQVLQLPPDGRELLLILARS